MEFHKNRFLNSSPTKIAGNKVLKQNSPFELSKNLIHKNTIEKKEQKPLTPEERYQELQNQNHFIHRNNSLPK